MHAEVTLAAGQMRGLVLETGTAGPVRADPGGRGAAAVRRDGRLLDGLARRSRPTPGRWRETLNRSAITLKLMTYAPTGGLVAAPTAGAARADRRRAQLGLPLHLGPRRLVLGVLAARHGLHRRRRRRSGAGCATGSTSRPASNGSGPLKIMYRVDGSSDLTEEVLEHWEGYRGSAPVRIGNGAADQLQLDIYGEAMDSIYFADQHGLARRPPRLAADPRPARLGQPTTGTSRRRASGRPAAAGRTSPTAG